MKLRDLTQEARELLETLKVLVQSLQFANKRFLTVKHAAVYSDLSEESIRRLLDSQKLTALRPVKGRILIDRQEIDAYILSCTSTPRKGRGRRNTK